MRREGLTENEGTQESWIKVIYMKKNIVESTIDFPNFVELSTMSIRKG